LKMLESLHLAQVVQKLPAKRGVAEDDLVDRAVCDLFGVRRCLIQA
jgi:hypothetical protein